MEAISKKEYLSLKMPSEEQPASDHSRIRLALEALGYDHIDIPLHIIRRLYPMCRDGNFDITVTLVHREYDWVVVSIEPGDTRRHHYGLAVDYGSTTIVMQLVDLNSGTVIAEEKDVNEQAAYGTDILTRITFSLESSHNADALQKATVQTFHKLFSRLQEASGIAPQICPVMILSGNTTMIHFLLKLNAWTVFASPYAPVISEPGFLWGRELGMDFNGLVYIVPAASNYIGGDIISGLLVLDIHKQEKTSLFFDIGTNGELVIGNKDWMLAGAGAAGPALEGYISRHGMRAAPGAIDKVVIDGKHLHYTTIDNQPPVGICGSGIIDLLAQMRLNGWVDISGQLNPTASEHIRYIKAENQYAVVYAHTAAGKPLYFSQQDIVQYLDTKSAAYTMVECLLESAGTAPEELDRCYLSGAFTAHSNLESAITIGIFPDLPREKYIPIRNTSLDGARTLLLDHTRLQEARELAENIYCVQFASFPDFLVRMQAAKFIPHTDMRRYPSIAEKVK